MPLTQAEAEELELLELEMKISSGGKAKQAAKPQASLPQWDGVVRQPEINLGSGLPDTAGLRQQMLPEATRESRMEGFNQMMEGAEPAGPGRAWTAAANVAQSGTLGLADDIAAVPKAIIDQQPYGEARQDVRNAMAQGREDYPATSFGGEMAGYLAPGTVAFKAGSRVAKPVVQAAQKIGPSLGFGSKVATGAGVAAADAALYGGTVMAENEAMAEGGEASRADRAQGAQEMAPWGAGFGAAIPVVAPALRPVGRWAGAQSAKLAEGIGLAPGAVERHSAKVGAEAVRRDLERAGIFTIEDFAARAAKYGDKPVVTGELTQPTLNTLTALVRGKGTTAEKAQAVLEDRVQGLPGRFLRDISEETGLDPEDVFGTVEEMVRRGRAKAAPAYEAAEEANFAETANLERIIQDSPILQSFMPTAVNRVQHQAVPRIGQADQMPPLKVYDELKQLLDEEISKRIRNEQGIDDIEGVRRALVDELDLISRQAASGEVVPPDGTRGLYEVAREVGGDAPRAIAGRKMGERALSGARFADDIEREIAEMTGGQLTAAQGGVVRSIVKDISNGNLSPKRISVPAFRQKLVAFFGDDVGNRLVDRFKIEAELMQKGARWNPNVGSVTSQAQLGQPSKLGDEMVRAGANFLTGNKVGLAAQMVNAMRRHGYSEAQLNAMGDILLSSAGDAGKTLFPKGGGPKPNPLAAVAGNSKERSNALSDATPDIKPTGVRGNAFSEDPQKAGASLADDLPPPVQNGMGGGGPLKQAKSQGYKGEDIGEAAEWVAARNKGLDMSKEARMERAKAMGFDTDTVLYHGSPKALESLNRLHGVRKAKSEVLGEEKGMNSLGIWLSSRGDDAGASMYAQGYDKSAVSGAVYPVHAKAQNPLVLEGGSGIGPDQAFSKLYEVINSTSPGTSHPSMRDMVPVRKWLKEQGYDSVVLRESYGDASAGQPAQDIWIVLDDGNIRSTNAAFDPDNAGSSNILAGLKGPLTEAGVGSAGGSVAGSQIDLNQDGKIDWKDSALGAAGGAVGVPAVRRLSEGLPAKGAKAKQNAFSGEQAKGTLDLTPQNRVYGPGSPDDLGFYTSAERALANPPPRFKDAKALTADQWRAYFRDAGVSKEGFEYQVDAALKSIGAGNGQRIPKAQVEEALARARPTMERGGAVLPPLSKRGEQAWNKYEMIGDDANPTAQRALAVAREEQAVRKTSAGVPARHNAETDYKQYVAPGKHSNYSQETIVLPEGALGSEFVSHNWKTPGTLGHLRTTQRRTANGEKTLHVEELQSDLHQEGARFGYAGQSGGADAAMKQYETAKARYHAWAERNDVIPSGADALALQKTDPVGRELAREYDRAKRLQYEARNQPPRAPLENWEGVFIERALYKAAQEGHDLVTFPVGRSLHEGVGTEGTKRFYDERLPKHLASVAKKYGLKVERVEMRDMDNHVLGRYPDGTQRGDPGLTVPAIRLTPQAKKELSQGVQMMGGIGMAGAAGGTMVANEMEQ